MDGTQIVRPVPALARLLGEEQATTLTAALGRAPWRGRITPSAARALFDWNRLNDTLAAQRLDRARLYLSGAERHAARTASGQIDPARLTHALRSGATLILNAAQDASPGLRDLCESLAVEFTCVCQANLYACWRSRPGFDVHWDDHDVIVVQAEGRKLWALYGATREAPLIQGDPPEHRPPAQAEQEFHLEAGDVLYVPRGVWHAAKGVDEPSLHLTIGLTRRTGADFLHWLADTLVEDAAVRRDLPFEQGDGAVAARLVELLALAASEDPAGLARRYRRHLEAAFRPVPRLCFPAIGGSETAPGEGERIVLAPGAARLEPAAAPGSVVLSWRGDRFTVSARLETALRSLVAGEAVSFRDLVARAAPEDARAFVQEMVRRGAFLLRGPPQGAPD